MFHPVWDKSDSEMKHSSKPLRENMQLIILHIRLFTKPEKMFAQTISFSLFLRNESGGGFQIVPFQR